MRLLSSSWKLPAIVNGVVRELAVVRILIYFVELEKTVP